MNNKKIIAASILSANFAKLGEEASHVLQAGADWIHFDVMDNHFVPNLTVGPMVCKSLRDYGITAPIDAHLMVQPTDTLIKAFAKAGATLITIHPEATNDLIASIKLIKDLGCQAGIAINPDSDINCLTKIYSELNLILIMSVYPGFAGQKFIATSFEKIKLIKDFLQNNNANNIMLSIDGGVNLDNIASLSNAGINIFVAGNSIFNNKDKNYSAIIASIKNLVL